MAFWSRMRQSKPKADVFSSVFKRCYVQNHVPYVINRLISSGALIPDFIKPNFMIHNRQLEFFDIVRFFAAPVQVNQKKEERDNKSPRRNEQITSQFIRLVSEEGHIVVSRYKALQMAKELDLDLVEVDRHAEPPVCKIFDYHKEKYLRVKEEKKRAKSKSELKSGAFKEVRFAAKINPKDLQMKADMVKRLMESGHRVKCTAIEPTSDLDLETLLSRFSALIQDVAIEESAPKVEKKQAFMVVRHVKFGPSKKGSGKKAAASKADESSTDISSNTGVSEMTAKTQESEQEIELSDEEGAAQTKKLDWADFDTVFDTKDQENGAAKNLPVSAEVPKHGIENRYAKNPKNTMNTVPQYPNQEKRPQFNMNPSRIPQYEVPKHSNLSSSVSPPNRYNQGKQPQSNIRQPLQVEVPNRYSKKDPNTSGPEVPPYRNPQDSRISRGPGFVKPDQGRGGRFNADGSNVISNNPEGQAEIRRR